jgi:TyrR family helix-turn-helix protein
MSFFGMCVIDNRGAILNADRFVTEALDMNCEAIIGRNVTAFFPDYSLNDLYAQNERCNIQILRSRRMMAFTFFDMPHKRVCFKILFLYMETLYNLFRRLNDGVDETARLFSRALAAREEANRIGGPFAKNGVVATDSDEMKALFSLMEKTAPTDAVLLLTGETGVGKSMFARIIHSISRRKDGPFVEVNCGAIHGNLIESELFDYEKGAFTGADVRGRIGRIEAADGGTLFLDEITEIPIELQQKLLQTIQEKRISRLGSNRYIDVDFRLISATNREIEKLVEQHRFRRDLYYRINVIPIHIPPLRARKNDIVELVLFFTRGNNEKYSTIKSFSKDALQTLCHYDWPGNVRELENFVERMILTSRDTVIERDELPLALLEHDMRAERDGASLRQMMEDYEKKIILDAYSKYKTSVRVARKLSISQTSAAQKIRKYRAGARADAGDGSGYIRYAAGTRSGSYD